MQNGRLIDDKQQFHCPRCGVHFDTAEAMAKHTMYVSPNDIMFGFLQKPEPLESRCIGCGDVALFRYDADGTEWCEACARKKVNH